MRITTIIYLVFLLLNSSLLFSQSQDESPKVIVFNSAQSTAPAQPVQDNKNLVKINVLSPLSGDIALNFERKIKAKVSLEGGAGVTVKNYLGELFKFQNPNYSSDAVRTYSTGYSVSGGLRYYPLGAIKEYYFAPEVRYRLYNSEVLAKGITYAESSALTDFKLTFGYVDFFESNIFIEYFAGVGIRKKDITAYHESPTYTSTSGYTYAGGLTTTSSVVPLVAVGLKIGFAF